ncbi:hypothetical protein QE370_000491 [Aeromicrobium sp. SORGH_AS981]|nr:hypothetical protein [Aeromicrobium sp. SORGH_AS_0981]
MGVRRRRRPRQPRAAAAVRAGRRSADAQVHQPRHGGVPRPRPHHGGLHADPRPATPARPRGGHRPPGLPPRRAGRDDPAAGVGRGATGARWRGREGPAGQGREPADGAGRGLAARLAAGHVDHEAGVRHALQAGARLRPPSRAGRERPHRRRRAQPVRRGARLAARRRARGARGHGAGDAARDGAAAGRGRAARRRRPAALHARRPPAGVRRRDRLPDPSAGGGREPRQLHVRDLRAARRRDAVRAGATALPGVARRRRRRGPDTASHPGPQPPAGPADGRRVRQRSRHRPCAAREPALGRGDPAAGADLEPRGRHGGGAPRRRRRHPRHDPRDRPDEWRGVGTALGRRACRGAGARRPPARGATR